MILALSKDTISKLFFVTTFSKDLLGMLSASPSHENVQRDPADRICAPGKLFGRHSELGKDSFGDEWGGSAEKLFLHRRPACHHHATKPQRPKDKHTGIGSFLTGLWIRPQKVPVNRGYIAFTNYKMVSFFLLTVFYPNFLLKIREPFSTVPMMFNDFPEKQLI